MCFLTFVRKFVYKHVLTSVVVISVIGLEDSTFVIPTGTM